MWTISPASVGLILQGYICILMALSSSTVLGLIYVENEKIRASSCIDGGKISDLLATAQLFIPFIRAHARGHHEERRRIIFPFDLSQFGVVRSKVRFLEVAFVERALFPTQSLAQILALSSVWMTENYENMLFTNLVEI